MPVLMVFGDYVDQHPRWAAFKKIDTEYGNAIKAAGGTVDWINLPDIGIKGNSHMLMQDKNNAQIAEVIQKWLVGKGLVGLTRGCSRILLQRSAELRAAGKVTLHCSRNVASSMRHAAHPCAGLVLAGGAFATKSRAPFGLRGITVSRAAPNGRCREFRLRQRPEA